MEKVTVFLRTSLFSRGGADAHVPGGAMILDGSVVGRPSGSLTLEVHRMLDDRGRELVAKPIRLDLPWSKIDHVWVHES